MKKLILGIVVFVMIASTNFVFSGCNDKNTTSVSDEEKYIYSDDKIEDRIKSSEHCSVLRNGNDFLIIYHKDDTIEYIEQFIYIGNDDAMLRTMAKSVYSVGEEGLDYKAEILSPFIILRRNSPKITTSQLIKNYKELDYVLCDNEINFNFEDDTEQ